ncbi:MAG TPA: cupin domain-containing protein [Syntrophobacteraceae bacterium]|nr:cupin domain-containing protein [Syntrophobacteraceae bacterium]
MFPKIEIESLPVTDSFVRRKRVIQPRGELALIEDGGNFRHLGYFSLKSGPGLFRGGHYHRKKTEHFYVVGGELLLRLVDVDTGEKAVLRAEPGQVIRLHPGCAHRFEAVRDAQVIEYYDGVYDREDDVAWQDF